MRLLILVFSLLVFTGCGQIHQMNENMQTSNERLEKNTATVQRSSDVIQKNTEEIARSTDNMQAVGKFLPVIMIVLLGALFYLTFVLIKLHRKLKLLIENLKK